MKIRLSIIALASLLAGAYSISANAGNSVSKGHGVKCSWVLVSSANGSNVYQQVCRRGP